MNNIYVICIDQNIYIAINFFVKCKSNITVVLDLYMYKFHINTAVGDCILPEWRIYVTAIDAWFVGGFKDR